MLDYIKNTIRAKHVIIISVNALCLIAFIVCLVLSASIRTPLRSQQAAGTWAGQSGERFAQLSVFFPESIAFNADDIHRLHSSIDSALLAVSFESEPGRTLYTDAWSSRGSVSIISERTVPMTAPVIGVGGDFFLFHPLRLRDGSYLSPSDIMKDRVVIDEELAWRLFGSVQLAGFEILINNKPFIIAGVVARESDFASSRAYTDGAGLFMSFDVLSEMNEGELSISCYEIVMPDPITGFALGALTDFFEDQGVHIIENSARFSLSNSFATIRAFGERSMRADAITYPYWENAARFAEDWLALLLFLTLVFTVCPIVFGVIYAIKLIRYLIKRGKKTVSRLIKEHDDRAYEKYLLEHDQDHQIYDVETILRELNDNDP